MSGPDLAEAQYIARIYAALNEKGDGVDMAGRGFGHRRNRILLQTTRCGFNRSDPRFESLMQKAPKTSESGELFR